MNYTMGQQFTRFLCTLLFATCAISSFARQQQINLSTSINPPYQSYSDNALKGLAVDQIRCIFVGLQQPYRITVGSRARSMHDFKNANTDAIFTVTASPKMDRFGKSSDPLLLEKWYWYTINDASLNQLPNNQLQIGVLRESNQEEWLNQMGYRSNTAADRLEQLFKLLHKGRIDAFLADSNSVNKALQTTSLNANFHRHFSRFAALSAYFSYPFIDSNPNFLSAFNQALSHCKSTPVHLEPGEKEVLNQITQTRIVPWANNTVIVDAVLASNIEPDNTAANIASLEQQWNSEPSPLKTLISQNALSHYLNTIQQQANGLFSEIIVMNQYGFTVGMSRPTSDYWQGDEEHFARPFTQGANGYHIAAVNYDASSRHFQSQISMTLTQPQTNQPIGVITVGIDIEKAFQTDEAAAPTRNVRIN